jgi:hypothetical protein
MIAPLTGAAEAADVQASPIPATMEPTIKIVRIGIVSFSVWQRILSKMLNPHLKPYCVTSGAHRKANS